MAGLYVDENLAGQFVTGLRDRNHDVVFAGDIGEGRTDAWHFREAFLAERVLLTLDKSDYRYFHQLWTTLNVMRITEKAHAGILVAIQIKGFNQTEWLEALDSKLDDPTELSGRMLRWHPTQGWHEDDWKPEE